MMIAVFLVSFFNYAAVYELGPWDSRKYQGPIVNLLFQGVYPFGKNAQWYNDIGSLVIGTLLFNLYWPIVEFLGFWSMRYLFRALD